MCNYVIIEVAQFIIAFVQFQNCVEIKEIDFNQLFYLSVNK